MKAKQHYIFASLFLLLVSFAGCNEELEELDGERLIKELQIAGKYKVQITPKMMGMVAVTTGEHDAELIHEGKNVLRLRYTGFRREPMPFEMSVNVLMKILPAASGGLKIENIGGDFDADLPKGVSAVKPEDAPPGITIPEDALTEGIHSNGASAIEGSYKKMSNPYDSDGEKAMNFDWKLHPNVGLPVVVSIRTNKKIE